MKRIANLCWCSLAALLLAPAGATQAQTVLAIDFNDRTNSFPSTTMPGFDAFVIDSVGSATAVQGAPSVRTFGAYTVTVGPSGPGITYDDRARAQPTNNGAFTQNQLLSDFVFCGAATNGTGLDITIDGLLGTQLYKVTIWSYDNSSTGNRVSDWTANGILVRDNYIFNGSVLPTDNSQNSFNFSATTTPEGRLLIQGRRDAATSSAGAVFVNALMVEETLPDPPGFPQPPAGNTVFGGDNLILSCTVTGTFPMAFQWYHGGTPVANATNNPQSFLNLTTNDAGAYQLVATNVAGAATSEVATVIVRAVDRLQTGLISHWPMETIAATVPDATTNHNDLFPINMDESNLTNGRYGNALVFNGVDEYLMREHTNSLYLPVYPYPAYTVCLWVKAIGTNQTDRRVYEEGSNTNQTTLLTIGTANVASNAADIFIRNDNGGNPVNHRKSSLAAFDNTWHHIAWVDNNGFGTLYIDGVADTNNFNYLRGPLTPNLMAIGAVLRTNAAAFYAGAIDEVAVWRRSLSSNEVQAVIANALTPIPLRIADLQINGPNLNFSVESPEASVPHQILEALSLPATNWIPVTNVVFGEVIGNRISAQVPLPDGPQRYYRVGF